MTKLAEIVSHRLAQIGRGPTQAEGVGKLGKNFITDIVSGKKTDIRSKSIPALAKALDWSTADLLIAMQKAGLRFGEMTVEDVEAGIEIRQYEPKVVELPQRHIPGLAVPVYGVAAASVVGSFEISEQIDMVRRPPGLPNATNLYALYVHGESMSPRYRSGDLIFVLPTRPARAGDDVIIQTRMHDGAPTQSWLKELDQITDEVVVAKQLNPSSKIDFKRSTVVGVHRVLTMRELFGA